ERFRALLAAEPGACVLTDYLVTSFHRSVVVELGLDRYPELRDTCFGHYRRVVWVAQRPPDRLCSASARARARPAPPGPAARRCGAGGRAVRSAAGDHRRGRCAPGRGVGRAARRGT